MAIDITDEEQVMEIEDAIEDCVEYYVNAISVAEPRM